MLRSTDPLLFQCSDAVYDSRFGELPGDLMGMPFPRWYERVSSIQEQRGSIAGCRRRMVALESAQAGNKSRNSWEAVMMSDMARAGRSVWRKSAEPISVKRSQDEPANIMLFDFEETGRYTKGLGLENWVSERWVGDPRRWEWEQREWRRQWLRQVREEYERYLRKVERECAIRQGSQEILA